MHTIHNTCAHPKHSIFTVCMCPHSRVPLSRLPSPPVNGAGSETAPNRPLAGGHMAGAATRLLTWLSKTNWKGLRERASMAGTWVRGRRIPLKGRGRPGTQHTTHAMPLTLTMTYKYPHDIQTVLGHRRCPSQQS